MARKFFYVCGGLFLLALSYHLGARSAGAQSGGNPVASIDYGGNGLLASGVDASGQLSMVQMRDSGPADPVVRVPFPVPSQVLASYATPNGTGGVYEAFIVCSDGTIYRYLSSTGGGWQVHSHLFGGATATQSTTWGQVKDRYRK
jgi:hypothetical protein